jgi:hypothetical protein
MLFKSSLITRLACKNFTPGIFNLHAKLQIRNVPIFSLARVKLGSLVANLNIEKFPKFIELFLVRVFLDGYLGVIGK